VASVRTALAEDVGPGDLTAGLIPQAQKAHAVVMARQDLVVCGRAWFNEVFSQLDESTTVEWHRAEGEWVSTDQVICEVRGPARAVLTGERTALNFLQLLSGTATAAQAFVKAVAGTEATILDTRKTLPGLRLAQKYAVKTGGADNHRFGLYDAILIKENHIVAAGSIENAVAATTRHHDVLIEIEVETPAQVSAALTTSVDRLLLDNFSISQLSDAVKLRSRSAPNITLEASGGITLNNVRAVAETGVDFISVGGLTKDVTAADLSMRFRFVE
jgi:nicotinate-nucleotide pyrophosphorylase (carboxylating)